MIEMPERFTASESVRNRQGARGAQFRVRRRARRAGSRSAPRARPATPSASRPSCTALPAQPPSAPGTTTSCGAQKRRAFRGIVTQFPSLLRCSN